MRQCMTSFAALTLLGASALCAAPQRTLSHHVPPAVAAARRLGPLSRTAELRLAIGLPLRHQDELDALVQDVAAPASPAYRNYLTPEEFTRRFGPTEADYAAVTAFAESHGLKVAATHPNRLILDVTGTVSAIEAAFSVQMAAWSDSARGGFYAPDREPSVDSDLPIVDITGIDNYVVPRPMNVKATPLAVSPNAATGSGPGGFLIGGDFRAAYAPGVKLTGTGQTIGLFELDGFYASDVTANFKQAGLPAVPVRTVLLDGFSGSPGQANVEVILDIVMAAYMAPGANIVVYEGTNWNDVLNRMATDNSASQLSCSWGFSPINATTENIFKQYIAQGQSFYQASGDDGAYTSSIFPPSDDPNVTVVGGTHLMTTGPGGSWLGETAWSGSGGGVSTTYAIPSYQQAVKMAAVGGSTSKRNIPDVSLTADIQTFLIEGNGQAISVGGTSAAAPLWAGFTALVNQQALSKGQKPVGFVNPALYSLGLSSSYSAALHDIISGSDGFNTAPGYDLVTGWGSPAGQPLIDQLTGAAATPAFALAASPASLSIVAGKSATSTISITPSGGFSGSVALSVTGLPAGVTASFSSPSATSSSLLTLTVAATAAAGNSTLTITGKSGSLTGTFSLSLTVTPSSTFTIAVNPTSIGLVQGNSAKVTVTLASIGNFTGTVNVSVSGLPPGLTGTLSRGTTATTLTLMLTASSVAVAGSSTVNVIGTSGSVTQTASIALTISGVPSFSLSATPAALSVAPGASATGSVAIAPLNGFTSPVTFTASGLPKGVTAQFGAVGSNLATTLTFAASASAAPGTATVTITGTAGPLVKTTTVSLTIALVGPSFTIATTTGSAGLTLNTGSTVSTGLTVVPSGGFSGKVAFAATGLPKGVTAAFAATATGSTVTFAAAAGSTAGAATVALTGTSGNLSKTINILLTVLPPSDFSLAFPQGGLSVLQGTTGSGLVAAGALNGFTGTIALAATGLPSGVTASFTAASSGISTVSFTVAPTAAKGQSTVTITGTSGALSHKATLTLSVIAAAAGTAPVDLSSAFNIPGLAIDTVPFINTGIDTDGYCYSGMALGASQIVGGIVYTMGPMAANSAVSGKTITLPAGQYTALKFLGTAVNGNQPAQTFTVNYTDGTKSTFTQSMSDWISPQNYPGESTAVSTPYRDNASGTIGGPAFMLYDYSFPLTPGKTVRSVVLPGNRNVAILAMTLTGSAAQAR